MIIAEQQWEDVKVGKEANLGKAGIVWVRGYTKSGGGLLTSNSIQLRPKETPLDTV